MRPSLPALVAARALAAAFAFVVPALLNAQVRPAPDSVLRPGLRTIADTDSVKHPVVIPGLDLPFQVDLRLESNWQRFRNLRCTSAEVFQSSTRSSCDGRFEGPNFLSNFSFRAAGTVKDRVHVNVDYDQQREFESSQLLSAYYEAPGDARLQRVDLGNINFAAPASRFITSALPSGNYGLQVTNQFGRMRLRSIVATQSGNVVQNKLFNIGGHAQQFNDREISDFEIERLRFFFTIDPALFGRAYPNVDILNRAQLDRLSRSLPDTLRPTRVFLYRLQFGGQPQDPNGPRFRVRGDPGEGRQTYDLLREGVDYYMDPSQLWFALVRPLNESNERLVVAYNVKINGRDTIWTSTGGTPDLKAIPGRDQVANLVMDPAVGPTSPAFRNEIRSVYRVDGENLVRQSTKVRVVTGSGLLEHPLAGSDATFLQMFGLAQPSNPGDFDYENRLWPRRGDAVFNLGVGAPDVRNGQSIDAAQVIRDYFLIFPSTRPFSARDSGLVTQGNPTNDPIYTIPGEYLYSVQHPASVYRLRFTFETVGTETFGTVMLGATQMRPNSERILVDGRPLVRGLDYRMNYDIGQVEFTRPDTLFRLRRRVEASYEENPIFAASTTRLAGLVSELPVSHGLLTFTAISQSQSNAQQLTRPTLGFQGASALTAGATGQFSWEMPRLTSLVSRLPFGESKSPSRLSLVGEIASSRPQFAARNSNTAYLEVFDVDGGINIPLGDQAWNYSSMPAYGRTLRSQFGGTFFEPNRASTLVWQTVARTPGGSTITFTRSGIDPLLRFAGAGIESTEPVLWLTLLPLDKAGDFQPATKQYNWTYGRSSTGRRWRSIRSVLSPAGIDLTANEHLEFWALVDTTSAQRGKNPSLIFDFGDVSENTLSFAPETLTIRRNGAKVDSLFTGRRLQGFDSLDTERDRFSHAFNADANDTGLPGDVVDTLVVIDGPSVTRLTNVRICRATPSASLYLGDQNQNCTVGNHRLDEEDIDLDQALNFSHARRESERLLRYVVDLNEPGRYKRVGGSFTDTLLVNGVPTPRTRRWVLVSIPFKSPTDSLNDVNRRRIRALRLTVVSGPLQDAEEATQLPIAELRVTGAPWLNRSSQTLAGIGDIRPDGGFSVLSTIGTNDSSAAVIYQPPPGVGDQPDSRLAEFAGTRTAINESSMRIQAGNLPIYHRVEAYNRFPAGPQYFLGYQELRVWARGRGNGWGTNGDLQMFMKVGRDENNFYMRRTPAQSGATQAAWTDVPVDFDRFKALRNRIERDYLAGKKESIACTGIDSALVAATPIPVGVIARRFAACDDGYIAYTIDPAVTAPNLGAVQELAVGIVRVASTVGATPIQPGDTLELWIDDIRLNRQVNTTGFAGQLGMTLNAADFGDLRLNISNRDPNFRQLGEQPTFLGQRNVDMAMTLQLQKLLPSSLGLALPLTVTKVALANDPLYLSRSDISGREIPGLRKPKNDLTTYSLTVRRTAPIQAGIVGPLLNNLAATTTYVTGVDRTEFQDGNARNLSLSLDYLVTPDSAYTAQIPSWIDDALGALPQIMRAGPINSLRGSTFRWNPTQLRVTSGLVRGDDKRVSFITPSQSIADQPATTTASSRLWRNGSVLELRPTASTSARWEIESLRDFRDYRDSVFALGGSTRRVDVSPGFERERTISTSFAIAPSFSSWFRPRADLGTQYSKLRDPNVRSFLPLPGVIGVDSVLATRDSLSLSRILALPRRMTAAQTSSIGTTIDIASAFTAYSRDSSVARRFGAFFAPLDLSYTRSLLAALDAAPFDAPLPLQLGLTGANGFKSVRGVDATTSGQTGIFSASSALLLPYGTSLSNRYRRTTTLNRIARPDSSLAHVDGEQTQFPDVSVRWGYRPAQARMIANFDASAGYVQNNVTVSLPNLAERASPELRRTHVDQFPISGSLTFAGKSAFNTRASFSRRWQRDSLPGSIARTLGNEFSVDAGGALHMPESLGLGLKNDLRTRFGVQRSRNTTTVADPAGLLSSRLQDNGRLAYNLTADANVQDDATLTLQASYIVTDDATLNHKFAQTVFSLVYQLKLFGGSR